MAKIFYTLLFLNVNELKLNVQFSFALPTPDALGSRRGKGHLLGQCSSEQHGRQLPGAALLPYDSKCGTWGGSLGTAWEPERNWGLTCRIRTCILTRLLGDLYAHQL